MEKIKLGILISGRGSNMEAILHKCSFVRYPAETVVVISNRTDAGGLDIAARYGIPAYVIPSTDRLAFAEQANAVLTSRGVDLVVLAGFMRILDPLLVQRWIGRIINIHPSLLPRFPGLYPHHCVILADDSISGCTVHHVTEQVDAGEMIAQSVVPVYRHDNPNSLAARILVQEHLVYPQAIKMLAQKILRAKSMHGQ